MGMPMELGSASVACVHLYPSSILQVEEQPSPSLVLPSSQSSSLNLMPSPHGDVHAPESQFGSSWQSGVQPSPRSWFPSSQRSLPSFFPSPHVVFVHAFPGSVQA